MKIKETKTHRSQKTMPALIMGVRSAHTVDQQ
jgi:hypothetical protein